MATATACKSEVASLVGTLAELQQSWVEHLDSDVPAKQQHEFTNHNTIATSSHPLDQLRHWVSQQTTRRQWSARRLTCVLKVCLKTIATTEKQRRSRVKQSQEIATTATTITPEVTAASKEQQSLRRLEWNIILLLELRIRIDLDLFLTVFGEVYKKLLSKKKKSRKHFGSIITQDVFCDFLVQRLSRMAVCLPTSLPFATFLTRHCLTERMWIIAPTISTHLFDAFELDNPYLSPSDSMNQNLPMPTITKRKKKKQRKSVPAQTPVPVRPRLPPKRKPLWQRATHFQANLGDMAKLLDQPLVTPATKKPRLTNTASNSSVAKPTLSSRSCPMVTPRTQMVTKATKPCSQPQQQQQNQRDALQSEGRAQLETVQRQLPTNNHDHKTTPMVIAETPHRKRRPSSNMAGTPNGSLHPVPTGGVDGLCIAETPCPTARRDGSNRNEVATTPHQDAWTHPSKGTLLAAQLFLSPATGGYSPLPSQANINNSKPKLFGVVRSKNGTAKQQPACDGPQIPLETSSPARRGAAVAAARAYLRRKS